MRSGQASVVVTLDIVPAERPAELQVPLSWSVIGIAGIVFRDLGVNYFVRESLSWRPDRETAVIRAFVATALEILAVQRGD